MEKIILDAIIAETNRQAREVGDLNYFSPVDEDYSPEFYSIKGVINLAKVADAVADAIRTGGQMVEKVR